MYGNQSSDHTYCNSGAGCGPPTIKIHTIEPSELSVIMPEKFHPLTVQRYLFMVEKEHVFQVLYSCTVLRCLYFIRIFQICAIFYFYHI